MYIYSASSLRKKCDALLSYLSVTEKIELRTTHLSKKTFRFTLQNKQLSGTLGVKKQGYLKEFARLGRSPFAVHDLLRPGAKSVNVFISGSCSFFEYYYIVGG